MSKRRVTEMNEKSQVESKADLIKYLKENIELDRFIVFSMGGCIRKVSNTWINPAKSRVYYEDLRRVFFKDESPEGLTPLVSFQSICLNKRLLSSQ